ncbi:Zinc carboxypeptidase [Mycena indigotica]|uniref:Inactive metallocarboxypeptidase ECM14 n=1 Tax=Mycena indigotica TaxID=2126181 RepID=A0A8H6S5W5_9AGAR|nr:Zinc carboxypeptidase [Mycena indigotica]KAF7292987.1 Zinc carboxypeptidase [Mycena indigotica]
MTYSALRIALLSLPCLAAAFEQQQVFDITANPQAQLERAGILRRFKPQRWDALEEVIKTAETHNLDIWQIHTGNDPYVDVFTPHSIPNLPVTLLTVPHTTTNITYPTPPFARTQQEWDLSTLQNTTFHNEYHSQSEVDLFLRKLVELHPQTVSLVELGHTAEGREMLGLKISKVANTTMAKLGFVVMGPQHAREWVATSTALHFAHSLLVNSSESGSLSYLLDTYDFHIIPSPNPDGYVYTWESDRFWYKNRQIVGPGAKCIGIDMNRNWGFKWKAHSDSPLFDAKKKKRKDKTPADPCSHWYPGHRAFEAAEVNNVANYLTKINGAGKGAGKGGVVAFVDLRSYGQMLAAPYSYKCNKLPKDAEDQMEALHGAAQAGRAVHGMGFSAGSLCELLYTAPGNILDYVYSTGSIKYTYAAFLRDTGTYGFALPATWIRPVGEETGEILAYLAKFIARQRGIEV